MASRNERKRRAKARHIELKAAVEQAFQLEAAKQEHNQRLIDVNAWHKRGTRCICDPGLAWWR